VALAALATLVISAILGPLVLALAGAEDTDEASLVVIALVQTTLWIGMLGSIGVVLRRRGAAFGRLRLRGRWVDVPVGIAVGVACQLLLVPLVSYPWATLLGEDLDALEEPACRLAVKADESTLGLVLLSLIVVVGAPVVEELFFRGFVQRAAIATFGRGVAADDTSAAAVTARRVATGLGIAFTAVLFGLTHFQLLQLPALIAFGVVLGVLAHRTGRLGPSIVAHMAFNATTVVNLVVLSSDDRCADVLGTVARVGGVVG